MQNIVLLIEPSDLIFDISMKAGNMYLNRFCIDEDAAFESTGIYYLFKNPKDDITDSDSESESSLTDNGVFQWNQIAKGLRKS